MGVNKTVGTELGVCWWRTLTGIVRKRLRGSGLDVDRVDWLHHHVSEIGPMIGRYTWKVMTGTVTQYGSYIRYAVSRKESKLMNYFYFTYVTGSHLCIYKYLRKEMKIHCRHEAKLKTFHFLIGAYRTVIEWSSLVNLILPIFALFWHVKVQKIAYFWKIHILYFYFYTVQFKKVRCAWPISFCSPCHFIPRIFFSHESYCPNIACSSNNFINKQIETAKTLPDLFSHSRRLRHAILSKNHKHSLALLHFHPFFHP